MLLNQNLAFTILERNEKIIQNNKFRISAPTWNEEFLLPIGSYYLSDIQHYFEYILENMEKRLIIFH